MAKMFPVPAPVLVVDANKDISDMTELVKGISPFKLMPLKALTAEYTDQPVDVSTTLEHENAVDFPSVTVCNKNRVSCRRLRLMIQHCHDLPQVTRGHLPCY